MVYLYIYTFCHDSFVYGCFNTTSEASRSLEQTRIPASHSSLPLSLANIQLSALILRTISSLQASSRNFDFKLLMNMQMTPNFDIYPSQGRKRVPDRPNISFRPLSVLVPRRLL